MDEIKEEQGENLLQGDVVEKVIEPKTTKKVIEPKTTKKVIEPKTTKKVIEPKTTKKEGKEEPKAMGRTVKVQFLSGTANAGTVKVMITTLAKRLEAQGKLEIIKN